MSAEDRVARAMAEVAAYHERRSSGDAESVDELLERCGDLRELVEPMLDLSFTLAEPAAPPRTRAPELERFGHFRLLSRLGQGGMGTVHLAIDESLGRRVALKQIRPENLGSLQARARFEREARTLSRVDHPNLCQVFYTGEEAETPYLVMQYVEGETLKAKIQRARTGEAPLLALSDRASSSGSESVTPSTRDEFHAIVSLVEKLARALDHAHEQGLVHRDVKPGNIMIREDGEPVVLDFGLVREEDADTSVTDSGQQLGTPLYMAPEQIVGKGTVDRRTDVYALGTTLYECLTLQVPFAGDTRQELFNNIIREEPESASKVNRAVPTDLAVIAAKAMDKEPRRRYQTALELATDLRRARELQPIRARRAGPMLRLQRWTRRNPVAALLIVSITLGLALSVYLLDERDDAIAEALTLLGERDVAIAEANDLLGERDVAIAEANEHLGNFLSLGVGSTVADLRGEAVDLFPAWPTRTVDMDRWLERARPLAADLPRLRAVLRELRKDALPETEENRRRGREQNPATAEIARLQAQRNVLAEELAAGSLSSHPDLLLDLELRIEEHDIWIAEQQDELEKRWIYGFKGASDQFLHDALVRVVDELAVFLDDVLPEVEERRRWAGTVSAVSIDGPADRWREAIEAIAASDDGRASKLYGGMELEPQLGLVPIGMDPESKLWEFHHLRSGEAPERDPDTGVLQVTRETGIVFVLIPGGTFWMGAQNSALNEPNFDPLARFMEAPVHEVTLDPFFLAKHELTQGLWLRLTDGARPSLYWAGSMQISHVVGYDHPVESLTWEDANELLQRHGLCLPTEAQWEYACRADTDTRFWTGDERESLVGSLNIADRAALQYFETAKESPEFDDGYVVHAPVDTLPPNPFGLHHMTGNVHEWCRDEVANYETAPPGPGDGLRPSGGYDIRVMRGASYADPWRRARSSLRLTGQKGDTSPLVGVRPCRALTR